MGRMRASAALTEGEIARLAACYAEAPRGAPPGPAVAAADTGSLGAVAPGGAAAGMPGPGAREDETP